MSRPTEALADPMEGAIAALTAAVGSRLRQARADKGLSRRALSDRSGVSQRYIAQVEAGAGNISIALLARVGAALDRSVAWFVTEPAPTLDGKARRIALIGLRGAGKSTLGRRAGDMTGIPFIELNERIMSDSGLAIADVMGLYGPEGYRSFERQAVRAVADAHDAVILAVAGGIVTDRDTYALLKTRFHTVWLKAGPDEHMDRVRSQGDERPMAGNPGAMDELRAILVAREALYAEADLSLDTSRRALDDSLDDLLRLIQPLVTRP